MARICGFTFIRNALKYDFPVKEAILSILPICETVYVAVGVSEDETHSYIASISNKIIIVDSQWNDALREGGAVLAEETNKAFNAIPDYFDWCIYIQGDEVIHEKYLSEIKSKIELYHNDARVDGLLLNYLHFYGNYQYVADSSRWYRKEVRIIRNNKNFYSYRDAQGFRKNDDEKLRVRQINACVYHYGYVKHPARMKEKVNNSNRYWHSDEWLAKNAIVHDLFDYGKIDSLIQFNESHPAVMLLRIAMQDWDFTFDIHVRNRRLKERFKYAIERLSGWRIGEYKNYNLIR